MPTFKCDLPEWLIVISWSAIEIYPAIRAVVMKYDINDRYLLVRYYLDRIPTEEDHEEIDVFATTFCAQGGDEYLDKFDVECIYDNKDLTELDCLDGFFYARRERKDI